jgi:hypothetical protein
MLRIIMISLILTGCSFLKEKPPVEKIMYVTTPLSLPPRPTLPTWKMSELECVKPEVKEKIKERDLKRRQYAEELEVVIKSTQK